MKDQETSPDGGISRRGFLKVGSVSVAAGTLIGATRDGVSDSEGESGPFMLAAGKEHDVRLSLNGAKTTLKARTGTSLLDTLRGGDLTGCKPVCEMGACGACTVLVNGEPVNSCLMLAVDAEGTVVETIESLASGETLHPVQQAFIEADASQCGFCTPGMILSCKALIDRNPTPDRHEVQEALAGNLCRCGTYANIFRAMDKLGASNRKGK